MSDEENGKLAEWLEPMPTKPYRKPLGCSRGIPPATRVWHWKYVDMFDDLDDSGSWEPPDFRNDEAANAMLLEKMASLSVDAKSQRRRYFSSTFDGKGWSFGQCEQRESHEADEWIWWVKDPDRKTAIVLAAHEARRK